MEEFGPGVLMDDAPVIDGFGELDADRLRFVDLDGSGTADLLYLGAGETSLLDQPGRQPLRRRGRATQPALHRPALVGAGVRLPRRRLALPRLVHAFARHEAQAIQYLRLTGAVPHRMLLSVSNSVGRETRLSYRSSAREYLRDSRSGHPWRTLLPQPPDGSGPTRRCRSGRWNAHGQPVRVPRRLLRRRRAAVRRLRAGRRLRQRSGGSGRSRCTGGSHATVARAELVSHRRAA